jgi:hypothetical protein
MTDALGYLLWWKVGSGTTHADVEAALGSTDIPLPTRPLPHDVFRRVTGNAQLNFDVEAGDLELTAVPVDSTSDKMLVRHIVGTVRDNRGVTQLIRKCGDVAFYYPPRGKNSKARMRVAPMVPLEDWAQPVQDFARHLQAEYEHGIKGGLDGQAVRRLIRAHLARQGALYLDGPYFVKLDALPSTELPLRHLFATLGKDSFMHAVPLPDEDRHREFLVRGLERAVEAGMGIDETLWKLVEA